MKSLSILLCIWIVAAQGMDQKSSIQRVPTPYPLPTEPVSGSPRKSDGIPIPNKARVSPSSSPLDLNRVEESVGASLTLFMEREPRRLLLDVIQELNKKNADKKVTIQDPEVHASLQEMAKKKELVIQTKLNYDPKKLPQEKAQEKEEDIHFDQFDLEIINQAAALADMNSSDDLANKK